MLNIKSFLIIIPIAICSPLFSAYDEFEKFIENARQIRNVPGAAVVIVKEDKVVFAKGFGFCRYGSSEKVDENTIFQLASVSKTFASAGIGIQVDAKRLSWDDEIIKFLPQCVLKEPYSTRYTTSRDLLAHRTGLPAFRGDLLGKLGYSKNEILYRIRFIEPACSFREKALYSNVGFFAAGELLAKLSNSTFEEAIQNTLLKPLMMTRSGFSKNLDNANVAASHAIIDGKVQVIPWDRSEAFPSAGGINSTAKDMGNWMILHLNQGRFQGKQILKEETIKEMHLPSMVGEISFTESAPIDENASYSFGMGWDNYNYQGKFIVEKGGALDGVRTVVTLIPELKMGIVILCNLNLTLLPEAVRAKFLEMNLGSNGKDLQKEIEAQERKIADLLKPEVYQNPLPIGHSLSLYTGTYHSELYGTFNVLQKDGKLVVDAGPSHWAGRLTPYSNDTFILQWPNINSGHELVTFIFGPDGKASELQTETLGNFLREKP